LFKIGKIKKKQLPVKFNLSGELDGFFSVSSIPIT